MNTCQECKYFDRKNLDAKGFAGCRIRPRQHVGNNMWAFPVMASHEWCGEFSKNEPAEEKSKDKGGDTTYAPFQS